MKALLIPVKDPLKAKTRLSALLTAEERSRLAWAMFEDVSRAAAGAVAPNLVFLVSSYAPAMDRARALGWGVLTEEAQESESASVDWASGVLAAQGFDAVMRLPADLPLVQAADIDEILGIHLQQSGAVLVPSRDGTGTNAIVRTPPTLFPSRFGPGSLERHKQEASLAGAECLIAENWRIALDIDDPEDIALLLEKPGESNTLSALLEMGIAERVGRKA